MRRLTTTLALAAALALGCSDPTAPRASVRVTVSAPTITIRNDGVATVGYTVFNAGAVVDLMMWAPCDDLDRCPGLSAGQEATVGYDQITFHQPGETDAVVYYWRMKRGGTPAGQTVDVKAVPVKL